jgi:signal transduction histidine kinase
MFILGKIENRAFVLTMALLCIVIISVLDYITGTELSFSIFYLIPISLLALYKGIKVALVWIASLFASILWFVVEYYSRSYSSVFYPIWNSFVRLFIFTSIGSLLWFLKEKDKKLNTVNKHLKELNEEKNTFIGTAAHDIRNPISVIYSFSDLLMSQYKGSLQPEAVKILNYISTLSRQALAILHDLLDVSKIESGKVELNLENRDYVPFVRQQVIFHELLAKKKNIVIRVEAQQGSIFWDFDSHYMSEVLDNLLTNAIKYSVEDGVVTVKISHNKDGDLLTEVADQGRGIAAEEQYKLFRYFQTTSSASAPGEKSTGLGLAIAKRIVDLHRGEIGVKSMPGQGSTFYFTLPRKRGGAVK